MTWSRSCAPTTLTPLTAGDLAKLYGPVTEHACGPDCRIGWCVNPRRYDVEVCAHCRTVIELATTGGHAGRWVHDSTGWATCVAYQSEGWQVTMSFLGTVATPASGSSIGTSPVARARRRGTADA